MTTTADRLLQRQRASWQKLTDLLDKNERHTLTPPEIRELGQLYRSATSDLALAQRDFPQAEVTLYLNQLVGRAHAAVYQSEPLQANRLRRFVTHGYPRLFRETGWFTLVAALLFILPGVFTAVIAAQNPETARWILPTQAQELIPQVQQGDLWTDVPLNERPAFSSMIMTNNIRVAFTAFAGGMLAGLFTVFVLIFNGILVGGLTGVTTHYGLGFDLWTFIIGHGVIELTVIFIAGGAGLLIGWAMLRPGLLSRKDAVQQAAQKAVRLIAGCVPLLMVAGFIEGFISPNELLAWPIKWGVGLVTGLLLYSYLLLAGRADASPIK